LLLRGLTIKKAVWDVKRFLQENSFPGSALSAKLILLHLPEFCPVARGAFEKWGPFRRITGKSGILYPTFSFGEG
jgi:hypothetical protein